MNDIDVAKLQAARTAAGLVESGMTVGLGSGTTANLVVRELAERIRRESLQFVGVPTSSATADLARAEGISLRDVDELDTLEINLDGADEIDFQFRMIKGRGGALLREKIVASAARRRVTIVTAEKRVGRLGSRMPLPVEVSGFGVRHTERAIRALGAETEVRRNPDGSSYVTDGGNLIIDCRFASIDDPAALEQRLRRVAGVFETGLFLGLCDLLIVGHAEQTELIENPSRARPGP
ncbi:MAG TPA: ribose-5-phosphate isomerase RpiA [Isosphaeraceae bacterium]|nr:ribose-5-phosphate isomerase RpiA [Isosphaeraceae bacterium]